jgi:hypothetical protein
MNSVTLSYPPSALLTMLSVSFHEFIHQDPIPLKEVRTLCPEENDTALVCFPAVEDLRGVQQIENGTG